MKKKYVSAAIEIGNNIEFLDFDEVKNTRMLYWINAINIANGFISENLQTNPWNGCIPAIIQDSQSDGYFSELICSKLTNPDSPVAWAPLPFSKNLDKCVDRFIWLPKSANLWLDESDRWENEIEGKKFCNGLKAKRWSSAFCVLHESAHCLHSATSELSNQQWLFSHLGGVEAPSKQKEIIQKLCLLQYDEKLNTDDEINRSYTQFFMSVQESFADCWAVLALTAAKGDNLKEACEVLANLRDGNKESSVEHNTGLALKILADYMWCNSEKISSIDAFNIALGAASEASLYKLLVDSNLENQKLIEYIFADNIPLLEDIFDTRVSELFDSKFKNLVKKNSF